MTERQIRIVELLHQKKAFITYREISDRLKVSTTTVRNDVAKISTYLDKERLGTITSKPHCGITLTMDETRWMRFVYRNQPVAIEGEDQDVTYAMIMTLMQQEHLELSKMQKQCYCSRRSLEKKMEEVKVWMNEHHMELCKHPNGTWTIHYEEWDYRYASWHLFKEAKDSLYDKAPIKNTYGAERIYQKMSRWLGGMDMTGIRASVKKIETTYQFNLSYDSTIRITFLIGMVLQRSFLNQPIGKLPFKPLETDGLYDTLIVEQLCNEVESLYDYHFSSDEKRYMTCIFGMTEIQTFDQEHGWELCQSYSPELCRFVVKLIRQISAICGYDLLQDQFLTEHLFLEVRVMIRRLHYGLAYKNPLLADIKTKYKDIMAMAWTTSTLFEKELGLIIHEDEIGRIALQIGGAVERAKSVVRAVIVCNYGIGISHILKERIEKEIFDLEIVDILSNKDIHRIHRCSCDIIITTLKDVRIATHDPIVVVNNLLLQEDMNTIQEAMKQFRRRQLRDKVKMQYIKKQGMESLFHTELVHLACEQKTKDTIIESMCERLHDNGWVTKGFVNSVMRREISTSTEIGAAIALPHGSPEEVIKSCVSVAIVHKPIEWHHAIEVDVIFLLALNSRVPPSQQLELIRFYKCIVQLTENPKMLMDLKSITKEHGVIEWIQQEIGGNTCY